MSWILNSIQIQFPKVTDCHHKEYNLVLEYVSKNGMGEGSHNT